MAAHAVGSTYPAIDRAALGALPVPQRSYEEQKQVADFLDRECERIEALSETLTTLESGRYEAMVRILRDEVGLDRWPSVQIRYLARTGTGHTPSREKPEYWVPEERIVPWFTLADVWQIRDDKREVVTQTAERISQAGIGNSSACKHRAGTVLLSRTASVGFSAVMGCDMAVSQDFMTWTCGPRLDPYFLLFALRAMRPELLGMMYGSTHQTIYMPALHALRTPLPPLDAQEDAVATIRGALRPHWEMRRKTTLLRERLTEYRDALTTEAVTGKLDVTRPSGSQLDESAHAAMEGERPEVLSA
jgi:type I restriction enzyme S subunit